MFEPSEKASTYFRKLIRTPEGILLVILMLGYILAFVFFDQIKLLISEHNVVLTSEYQLAFLLMPLLLFIAFLKMDITANSIGNRLLTLFVLLLAAAIPVFHLLRVF